jgi:hypothetical protein
MVVRGGQWHLVRGCNGTPFCQNSQPVYFKHFNDYMDYELSIFTFIEDKSNNP